ncbi:MAG: bifunctional riboflavin kinase/FAD synthetase [Bdellovibrionales bacterium]|nr:bifunctional riboflavin kinase/FAD synthetase [Bdellovibrionales bacterium]
MRIYHHLADVPAALPATAVTIGNFDGVHKGHQALLHRVFELARQPLVESLVMTFDPHPVQVLRPDQNLRRLLPLSESAERLKMAGVEHLFVVPFSREFSQLDPAEFFNSYLSRPLKPRAIIVGHDFSFGANRAGHFENLKLLGQPLGIHVEQLGPVLMKGEPVSSSRIRRAIAEGQVELAHELLGYPFFIRGMVEKGFARGRQIGFPTANLRVFGETLPFTGVYLTRSFVNGESYWSVTNIGVNPTFKGKSEFVPVKVESHLLDFAGDLYGSDMKLEFWQRLREEKKFRSVSELRTQIEEDVEWARKNLKKLI